MLTRNLVFLHRLDVGQFGEIYKANRLFDDRTFSIKRISVGKFISQTKLSSDGKQNHFDKLFREIKTMSRVQNSPHIVSHFDAWFDGPLEDTYQPLLADMNTKIHIDVDFKGKPIVSKNEDDTYFCILMELCENNLENWMDTTPLSERNLEFIEKDVIKQILIGLNFMHSQDIVHRDLNPKNILMIEMENKTWIKIGDLSLARELKKNDTSLSRQVGVRDFRSPEMERGDENYDIKTDIFSLGLIYLMLIHDFKSTDKLIITQASARRGNLEVVGEAEEIHKRRFPLLKQMLERKAENRPDTVQALDLLNKQ
jgi:serine/threonine protein kinase